MARGTDPNLARTIRSLAHHVGRAESTVRKWVSRDDWPFTRSGPWDVQRVMAWADIHLKPDPAAEYRRRAKAADEGRAEFSDMTPLNKAKIQVAIERALLTRQRRLVEAGKLHDVEDCEKRRLRQIHEIKGRMLALPLSVANRLVGRDIETIEAILEDEVTNICQEFAGGRIDE